MIVQEILDNPDTYIGQEVKVEGVMVQQSDKTNKQWYVIPEDESLSPETLTHKAIKVNHTFEDTHLNKLKYLLKNPPSPYGFLQACAQPGSPISKEHASQLWKNLLKTRQYEYLRQFIEAGALPVINQHLAPVSATYFPNTNTARPRIYLDPLPEEQPEYYAYSGYIVGHLRKLQNQKLELHDLVETSQETFYYSHIERRQPVSLGDEEMAVNEVTSAFDIVSNPSRYINRTLRIEGHIPLADIAKQLLILPFPIYTILLDKEAHAIGFCQSLSNIRTIIKRSAVSPLLESAYTTPVHIIGRLGPSDTESYVASVTKVSEMLIQTNVYGYRSYRNLDIPLEEAPI